MTPSEIAELRRLRKAANNPAPERDFVPHDFREDGWTQETSAYLSAAANALPGLLDALESAWRSMRIMPTLDCCYTGAGYADISGSHCPSERPCMKCEKDREIERLQAERAAAAPAPSLPVEVARECARRAFNGTFGRVVEAARNTDEFIERFDDEIVKAAR